MPYFGSSLRSLLLGCALALLAIATPASWSKVIEGGTGLCYGKDHAYYLTAPDGWILDTESGAEQGIFAVFYPKGSDWNGPVAMYTNAAARDGRNEDGAVDRDVQYMRKNNPKLDVQNGEPVVTADGKQASLRYFSGDTHGNREAVCYVLEKHVVINIVLTARSKAEFEKALPAFRKLVGSYKFLTDTPKIEKKGDLS